MLFKPLKNFFLRWARSRQPWFPAEERRPARVRSLARLAATVSSSTPILGIVCPRYKGRYPFGVETPFFEKLAHHARKQGRRLVVVSPRRLSRWDHTKPLTVRELVQDSDGGQWNWDFSKVPRLDVVVRKYGEIGGASKYRKMQRWLTFFNPYQVREVVTDKHSFASLLRQAKIDHPETERYSSRSEKVLIDFLNRHDEVFIKPQWGTLGKNIIHVRRSTGSTVTLRYKRGGKVCVVRVPLPHAHREVQAAINRLRRSANYVRFVIQEAVPTATYRRRPFSVRVIVHNRPGAPPLVIGTQARVGPLRGVTDNQGYARRTASVLRKVFRSRAGVVERDSHSACLAAFRVINNKVKKLGGHQVGELGFDVIFDQRGKPFVIEANSRPQILRGEPLFNPMFFNHVLTTAERLRSSR